MKNAKRKISIRARHQLLQIYLHMGLEESRRMCVANGVSPDYAAKRASLLGISQKRAPVGSRWAKFTNGSVAARVDHTDPRWAWALERGHVVAP